MVLSSVVCERMNGWMDVGVSVDRGRVGGCLYRKVVCVDL